MGLTAGSGSTFAGTYRMVKTRENRRERNSVSSKDTSKIMSSQTERLDTDNYIHMRSSHMGSPKWKR